MRQQFEFIVTVKGFSTFAVRPTGSTSTLTVKPKPAKPRLAKPKTKPARAATKKKIAKNAPVTPQAVEKTACAVESGSLGDGSNCPTDDTPSCVPDVEPDSESDTIALQDTDDLSGFRTKRLEPGAGLYVKSTQPYGRSANYPAKKTTKRKTGN